LVIFSPILSCELSLTRLTEEWVWYLLTLGPSVVVDLAVHSRSATAEVFKIARDMGWTTWRPCSKDCCRAGFLRNVAGKIYEQRLRASRPNVLSRTASSPSQSRQENTTLPDQIHDQPAANFATSTGLWARWADQHSNSQNQPEVKKTSKNTSQMQSPHAQQRYSAGFSVSLFPPQYARPLTPAPSKDY